MLINIENKGIVAPQRFIIDFELALVKAARKLFKCIVDVIFISHNQCGVTLAIKVISKKINVILKEVVKKKT